MTAIGLNTLPYFSRFLKDIEKKRIADEPAVGIMRRNDGKGGTGRIQDGDGPWRVRGARAYNGGLRAEPPAPKV